MDSCFLPPSVRFPPLREGNQTPARFPLRSRGNLQEGFNNSKAGIPLFPLKATSMRYRNRDHEAIRRARELRKTMGEAEKRLWARLRRNQIGFRFRRQVAVGSYVMDFYCPEARVCVEVDGDLHVGREERDAVRDAYLSRLGIETVRVWTSELYDCLDAVVERIYAVCAARVNKDGS